MEDRDDVRSTYEMLLFQMSDRARLLAKLGRFDAALDTYDRAEAITEAMADPGNRFTILQQNANLLEEMGMLEEAGKVREEVVGLSIQPFSGTPDSNATAAAAMRGGIGIAGH